MTKDKKSRKKTTQRVVEEVNNSCTCEVCGKLITEFPTEDTGCVYMCASCYDTSEEELQKEGILI